MTPSRRQLLQAAGITMALPWLDSFDGFLHAAPPDAVPGASPQRLLLVCIPLGIYRDALIPAKSGKDYETTEYLSLLKNFRDRLTVISGLDHPGVNGGHAAEPRIFTGVPSNKKNARSLDQYLAGHIGRQTRIDSLVLAVGHNEFSWTDSGSAVPSESKMSKVYARLFIPDGQADADKALRDIGQGKSILDLVQRQAKALGPQLSKPDQDKLEEYLESIRETQRRIVKSETWVHTPKPKVDAPAPQDPTDSAEIVAQLRNVCDIIHLAFKTDSTRVATFGYFQQNKVNIPGVSNGYHSLSHHGQDPGNIAQLKRIEGKFFEELNALLTKLAATKEGSATLLDRTTIIITSNLGNGSNHSNKNLPVLLLGGRYNHGQHLAFEPSTVPLSNLYVSVLNQFGLADKTFGTSTGPLKGLEVG
jgi:hypothetical protein